MVRAAISGVLGVVLLVAGCGGGGRMPVPKVPESLLTAPYHIHPGDALEVKFEYHPDDTRRVVVGGDGTITLPVTGEVQVAGLTLREAEALIEKRSARFLREPVVSVSIAQSQARAYIGGEVMNPGFVSLGRPLTAMQAVIERGGFLPGADLSDIVVLSHAAGRPVARRINLKENLDDGKLDGTVIAADEIVLVPKTGIAKANQWVAQWLNGMTPTALRAVRFGTIEVWNND